MQDRLGVRIKLIEPVNWSAVLEQARNNQLDLLPGIVGTYNLHTYDAERRLWLTRLDAHLEQCAGQDPARRR